MVTVDVVCALANSQWLVELYFRPTDHILLESDTQNTHNTLFAHNGLVRSLIVIHGVLFVLVSVSFFFSFFLFLPVCDSCSLSGNCLVCSVPIEACRTVRGLKPQFVHMSTPETYHGVQICAIVPGSFELY